MSMSPELKTLALKAGMTEGKTYFYSHVSPATLENFAELIIRECNTLVENYISDCGGEIGTLPDDVLLVHFGVK